MEISPIFFFAAHRSREKKRVASVHMENAWVTLCAAKKIANETLDIDLSFVRKPEEVAVVSCPLRLSTARPIPRHENGSENKME